MTLSNLISGLQNINAMRILIMIIIVLLGHSFVFAQDSPPESKEIQDLKNRIQVLENQKENLDKQADILQQNFDLKTRELNSQFTAYKLEVEKSTRLVYFILGALGLLTAGAFIAIILHFRKFIQKQAEAFATSKVSIALDTIVEDKKAEIIALINNQSIENRIKEKSRILALVESEEDQKQLQNFFDNTGFKNIKFEKSDQYKQPGKKIELIIFVDQRNTKNRHDLFREYIQRLEDKETLFIFYGPHFKVDKTDKLNFTNSKYTFYSQIINSLTYKEITKKN